MALQNLHEMIRNLSAYIKNLESLCENGIRLAKNFERLLSPGPVVPSSSSSRIDLDSDLLAQNATWELAQKIYQCWTTASKVATQDSNAMITEILPLLQEAVQNAMKDPEHSTSTNTYEVFRSCFSAFFQIQWRFCSLYLQCTSSGFPRTPDLARSPTTVSFSSSGGDRRESTESCMSSFSLPFSNPRSSFSSFSGLSTLSSRSTSPSPQTHHHYGHRSSRNSSPSVKFTPSQPPSPYGDYGYPYLFRRWSTHTHNAYGNNNTSSLSSGPSASLSGTGNYPSSGSIGSGLSGSSGGGGGGGGGVILGSSFNRRWSVPASSGIQSDSTRRNGGKDAVMEKDYDYGLFDVINLLSTKPLSSSISFQNNQKILSLSPPEETIDEFCSLENNTTSLWPPSEIVPEIVLTSCPPGHSENMMSMESLQRSSQSLRVPYSTEAPTSPTHSSANSITNQMAQPGEYSLFPVNPGRSSSQGS